MENETFENNVILVGDSETRIIEYILQIFILDAFIHVGTYSQGRGKQRKILALQICHSHTEIFVT